MKSLLTIGIFSCLILARPAVAQINDMDTELSQLSIRLSAEIKLAGKQKVAVIDFTDLDGNMSELGRYVSEQLTVGLVMNRIGFSVLDRANLKKILDEHKLSSSGLIDPDTTKKLGQFAGVDALILGTITPKDQVINVTAKVIATDTAEIVGASKATFKKDQSAATLSGSVGSPSSPIDTHSGASKGQGYFGFHCKDLDVEAARNLQLASTQGVLVTDITPESPAARDGLLIGDVIVEVNGKPVAKREDIHANISELNPGTKTEVKLYRNGALQTLTITLGVRPQQETPASSVDLSDDKPQVTKVFGNLVVELQSLRILRTGQYFLTMTLANNSARNSLWVALANKTSIISPNGYQFGQSSATGLLYTRIYTQHGTPMYEAFNSAKEIKPGESSPVTFAISSSEERPAAPGVCTVQMEFLLGDDFLNNGARLASTPDLVTKMEAK